MEHYITEIRINKLRHLSNLNISLNPEKKQHLIITGTNGSGKTSLLLAVRKYLRNRITLGNNGMIVLDREAQCLVAEPYVQYSDRGSMDEIEISFNSAEGLDALYDAGDFIIAFFPAHRQTKIIRGHGVEDIKLANVYDIESEPGTLLHKYMVHLKTQQSYARNEGDTANADRIQKWFDRFTDALRILLDDDSIYLEYQYKEYDFKIYQDGREPYRLDELSDGYSALIHIVSDLMLRMDKNWLLGDGISVYDEEGVVLIDELETHLHIELQKKALPFLTKFFPGIQFIVATHSPYILNSVSNAKAYDLEKCVALENLFLYSSEDLAEGYFDADEYSGELKKCLERYKYLAGKTDLTEDERAERAMLRSELKKIPAGLSREAKDICSV